MRNTIKSTLGICIGKELDQFTPEDRQKTADLFENVRYFLDLGDIYQRIDGTQGFPSNFDPVPVTDPVENIGKGDWQPWTSISNQKTRFEKDYPTFGGVTMFGVEALYVNGEFKKFPNKQWSRQERGQTDENIYNSAFKEMELFESTFPSVTHIQLNEYWAEKDVYEIVQKAYTDAAKRIKIIPTSVQATDAEIGGTSSYYNFVSITDLEFDTLSNHPYSFRELFQAGSPDDLSSPPEKAFRDQVADLSNYLSERGKQKDLWITECGWNSTGVMTEQRQAAYLVKSLFIAMAHGYTKYFIYQLIDKSGEEGTLFETTGLIDKTGRKKASYMVIEDLIESYGNLSFKQKLSEDSQIFKYIFTDGGKDYEVSWNPSELDTLPKIEEVTSVITSVEELEPDRTNNGVRESTKNFKVSWVIWGLVVLTALGFILYKVL